MTKKYFDKAQTESVMTQNAVALRRINNYLKWNLNVFPIEKNKRILDLGCGPGIYFEEIMSYSPVDYVAADYSSSYIDEVKRMSKDRPNCRSFEIDLMDPINYQSFNDKVFDYIFLFDVLEHLENDELILKNIYGLMKNCRAEALFLRVPALQWIYGENDKSIGHYRRYSAKMLKTLLKNCSFQIKLMRYQNCIGIIPWYIIGKILKRSLAVSNIEGSSFNTMVPIVETIERFIRPPLGLSLYCVCTL